MLKDDKKFSTTHPSNLLSQILLFLLKQMSSLVLNHNTTKTHVHNIQPYGSTTTLVGQVLGISPDPLQCVAYIT
jgi:hypothetical protein